MGYVDIVKIRVCSMVPSGKKNYKYFIGYKDDDYKIELLRIMLPKASTYVKSYDGETKWINFFIKDDNLLKSYNDIWNKVCNSIIKELDCKPVYNKIF